MEGCQLTAVYHFSDGGYVGKELKGLTMVVVGRPHNLFDLDKTNKIDNPLNTVVYLPIGISAKQDEDLRFVLEEHQSRFVWGKIEYRKASIEFNAIPKGYSIAIPGILNTKTTYIEGEDKKPMWVENVAFQEGTRWTLGKTSAHRYIDPKEKEWKWNYPANNGAWCHFTWDWIDHP